MTKMRAAREALERMRPAKMEAALEALKRIYQEMCVRFRGTRRYGLGKRLLAGLAFEACYLANRQALRENQGHEPLACVAKIDRVVVTATAVDLDPIGAISGYKIEKPRSLWNPGLPDRHAEIREEPGVSARSSSNPCPSSPVFHITESLSYRAMLLDIGLRVCAPFSSS